MHPNQLDSLMDVVDYVWFKPMPEFGGASIPLEPVPASELKEKVPTFTPEALRQARNRHLLQLRGEGYVPGPAAIPEIRSRYACNLNLS